MGEADPNGPQVGTRQGATDPDKCRCPELDLMTIRVPRHADIIVANAEIAALLAPQPDTLIGDGAVPFGAGQGLPKRRRGGEYEVEQADLAWLEALGEMETEQVIRERLR